MAKIIRMRHESSGLMRYGYYGFSWTTLFFGCFPALFRRDFITFLAGFAILVVLALATAGFGPFIAMPIWAFMYNGYYTRRLLEKGYFFHDSPSRVQEASAALGVTTAQAKVNSQGNSSWSNKDQESKDTKAEIFIGEKSLNNDGYKIHLVKKYRIENNEVLKKYILNQSLFDNVDLALEAAHSLECKVNEMIINKNNKIQVADALRILQTLGYEVESSSSGYSLGKGLTTLFIRDDEELIETAKYELSKQAV